MQGAYMDRCSLHPPEWVTISATMSEYTQTESVAYGNHELRYIEPYTCLKNLDSSCRIYFDDLNEQDEFIRLFPCAHIFCKGYSVTFFSIIPCCPISRHYIFSRQSQVFNSFESAKKSCLIECKNSSCIYIHNEILSENHIDYIRNKRHRAIPVAFPNTLICPYQINKTNDQKPKDFIKTSNIEIQSWVYNELEKNYYVVNTLFEDHIEEIIDGNILASIITVTINLNKKKKNALIDKVVTNEIRSHYLDMERIVKLFYSSDIVNGNDGFADCSLI